MLMSCAVEEEARNVQGKKALAVESFAKALRQIPTILADNAGLDSSDLVAQLRAAHFSGKQDSGLGTSPLSSPSSFRLAPFRFEGLVLIVCVWFVRSG
jgi:T-complex protein 1 subunit beta